MNPKRLNKAFPVSKAKKHRNFSCGAYAKCLDTAAENRWESFTCSECSEYRIIPENNPPDKLKFPVLLLAEGISLLLMHSIISQLSKDAC